MMHLIKEHVATGEQPELLQIDIDKAVEGFFEIDDIDNDNQGQDFDVLMNAAYDLKLKQMRESIERLDVDLVKETRILKD